jgi:hypothetical protein
MKRHLITIVDKKILTIDITMKWVEALKLYNQGRTWCVPRKGTESYEVIREIMKTGKMPEKKAEPKAEPKAKTQDYNEPNPEDTHIKLTPKLEKIIKEYNRGRSLVNRHLDGKTTNSNGFAIRDEALDMFYDEMKKLYGLNEKDSFGYLYIFNQQMNEKTQKKPEPKPAPKPEPKAEPKLPEPDNLPATLDKLIDNYVSAKSKRNTYEDTYDSDDDDSDDENVFENEQIARNKVLQEMKKLYNLNEKEASSYLMDILGYRAKVLLGYKTKPEPKPAPKPEPKAEPKPTPKPEPKPQPKLEAKKISKRRLLMNLISDMLSSGSRRDFSKVKKEFTTEFPEFANNDTLNAIFSGKDADFYPTPSKCLENEDIVRTIERADRIFEPTAGLGSMVDFIESINPKAEITANELNTSFIPILKKLFPEVKVINENFYDMKVENNYDTIVCNPPFSFGSNNKIYLDFLFKCLQMLNKSKATGELALIFICPNFIGDERDDTFDETMFFGNKNVIPALAKYIEEEIPLKRGKDIIKQLGEDDIKEKDEELADKIRDNYGFYQGRYIGKCTGFGGTNITAAMYQFIVINYARGSGNDTKKLKWVDALKIFNQGKEKWCIPKKGTPEYNEVKAIMEKGKKIKGGRYDPFAPDVLAKLEAKQKAMGPQYQCPYIYTPSEDIKRGDTVRDVDGMRISNTLVYPQSVPCDQFLEQRYNEMIAYKKSKMKPKGFWEQFAEGFFTPIKAVADVASFIPGVGNIAKTVSEGISSIGYGKHCM